MAGISQQINRFLYAITLLFFLMHPINIIYIYIKGRSLFKLLAMYTDISSNTLSMAALLTFPTYIILRWIMTGRFSFKAS